LQRRRLIICQSALLNSNQQPEIREALFNWYRSKGAIVFRDERWHGVEKQ